MGGGQHFVEFHTKTIPVEFTTSELYHIGNVKISKLAKWLIRVDAPSSPRQK